MADPVTAAVAVGWGMKAAGWLAKPVISELVKKGFSYLGFNASEKLKELEPKLLLLERVIEAVEESPDRPRLEQLFKDLKSAFYEAEDISDLVDYHLLERQILNNKGKSSDGDASPSRKRDWMKKKLQSVMPSSPLKNQVTCVWCGRELRKMTLQSPPLELEAHWRMERWGRQFHRPS